MSKSNSQNVFRTISFATALAVSAPAAAEVVVDLSAIGLRSEVDEKIAPGRSPVRLSFPGESEPTRVLLTPPPGVEPGTTRTEAPRVIEPQDSTPTPAPRVEPTPADTIAARPPVSTQPTSPEPEPKPDPIPAPAPIATPVPVQPQRQATTPPPAPEPRVTAAPTTPVEAEPAPMISAPEPPAAETRTTALTPPADIAYSLRFAPESDTILPETMEELGLVAAELMRHADRIEIQAYGGTPGDTSSPARRLSLKRGLAVRNYLISEGVLTSRISVRALGGVQDAGPRDRVDLKLSSR